MPTVIRGSDNIDTSNVATQTELNAKVQTAIVTVNGGANISVNSRYVEVNPFGNANYEKCSVRAEVYINGRWSEAGFVYSTNGFGTSGHSNLEGIVVQTGGSAVATSGTSGGGGLGEVANTTSAPCRVIVTYIGEAK